jgi:aminopeptidase-like protein
MKELIEELYLTNRAFVTADYAECLDYIDEHELSLTRHGYPSGTEIWDSWVVPQKWDVDHAYISDGDETLLEYDSHPLHLIAYSESFEGWVSREQLLDHLHTDDENEEAIPWHFRQMYRPWDSEWGFCAPENFVNSLSADEYYVSIDTSFEHGTMEVGEHTIEGKRDETIVLLAHLDHTGMANDDLSGVAAGIEIMRRLGNRDDLEHTYTLLLVQEMIGSAAYLEDHSDRAAEFASGIFLDTLGNDNQITVQRSFHADTKIDRVASHVLQTMAQPFKEKGFRRGIGNDELVFESPGFEIPTISINRFPYPEYHTHFDDPSIISEERLEDAVDCVLSICDVLERDVVPERTFEGLPSLANPKYDLYIDPRELPDIEIGPDGDIDGFRNHVFRYLDGDHSAFDIAEEFGITFDFVVDYLEQCNEKGLVALDDA